MRFNTIGERILCCRKLAKLTRIELERKHKLKISTLVSYEKNLRSPSDEKVDWLVNIFSNENVAVTFNWLKSGSGSHPRYLKLADKNVVEREKGSYECFDSAYFMRLEEKNLRLRYKDIIFHSITNNELEPTIRFGDRVAGLPISQSKLLNQKGRLCIIKTNEQVFVKYITSFNNDNTVNCCGNDPQKSDDEFFLANVKFSKIAPVFWIRSNPDNFERQ